MPIFRIQILIILQCLICDYQPSKANARVSAMSHFPQIVDTHSSDSLHRLTRHPLSPSECIVASLNQPCILKPYLEGTAIQRVLSQSLHEKEYRVHLEVEEGGVLYLPCSSLRELQNATVIWEHNMSTISVLGTLFTMDSRFDASGSPNNRFFRCSHSQKAPPGTFYSRTPNSDRREVFESWELVIDAVKPKDAGDYHCRLAGRQPQSLHYRVTVKKSRKQTIYSPRRIISIDAPNYARRYGFVNFTCSMAATHDESSRIILDWYWSPLGRRGTMQKRLIETQTWNNVSVYKEILGDSREGLRLDAVMLIRGCDSHHAGIYECQAHHIGQRDLSRVHDSLAVEFTVLPQWHFRIQANKWGLCPESNDDYPFPQDFRQKAISRIVLSDSPNERHQGQGSSVDRRYFPPSPAQNWTYFVLGPLTTSSQAVPPFPTPLLLLSAILLLVIL